MNYRRTHWIEKTSVQVVTLAVMATMYFGLWHLIQPSDPQLPMSFFAAGGAGHLGAFLGISLITALAVGILTVRARPSAAVMAAMLGVGGMALRSASFRGLLWQRQTDLSAMYWQLIGETAVLTAIILLAAVVVLLMRGVVGAFAPALLWKDPLAEDAPAKGKPAPPPTGAPAFVVRCLA